MKKSDIAITTVSWIRTSEERKIVLETVNYYSQLDIPIIIVDAGSAKQDQEAIKAIPNVIFLETKNGLTEQIVMSHKEAEKHAEYLFYTHTDKLDFAKNEAKKFIEYYRSLASKGVLIPSRVKDSFNTYPEYQKTEEEFLNFFVSDYIGVKEDYYAGPKIYPASFVKYLDSVQGSIGWGIEAYFYAIAKKLQIPFDFLPVFITAPIDIDDEEKTKIYRLKVVEWQIQGFVQGQNIELI